MNHLRLLFTTVVVSVLVGVAMVSAQSVRTQVDGSVTDESGAVVVGASVQLLSTSAGNTVSSETDDQGRFKFSDVAPGIYLLSVNSAGFSEFSSEIRVAGSSPFSIDVALSVGNISESVTVTATRTQVATSDTAVPVSVIDRRELEEKPVNTIGDVFRDLPGTSTVNEGSFGVRPRIRGLDSNRVLILVDGERLNNGRTSTSASGVEIGLVETDQIESVEVVRGSGSVLYGTDALGGTINIITKGVERNRDGGFRFGAAFNGYFSSNESGRRGSVALNGSTDNFAFRVAQTLERYGNYFTGNLGSEEIDGVAPDGEVLNSQSHGGNTQATAKFFFNDNNDLKINYERRRVANIGFPTLVGTFNAFFPFSDRDKFNGRFETRNVTPYLAKIAGTFYWQNQNRNFTNILDVPAFPPFFPGILQVSETVTDTDSLGFDVQTNWLLGNDNLLTAGVSGFRDRNEDARTIENFRPVNAVEMSNSVPDARFGSFAAFAQDAFKLSERLQIIGGIRIERFFTSSDPTEGFSLPGALTPTQIEDLGLVGLEDGLDVTETASTGDIGAVFGITNELSVTARIGRSFRVPNIFERFFTDLGSAEGFVVGNPNLEPESGVNFDTGLRFRNSSVAASITYFRNSYKNFLSSELAFDRNGDPIEIPSGSSFLQVYQTVNLDRVRIQGFEAEVEVPLRLGFGFLTPGGNVSYLRGDNLTEGEPLNAITPLKAVFTVRWENLGSNYFVDWSTRLVAEQERLSESFLDVNGGPEPGFKVSDLRGGYVYRRENWRMSFNGGITNIFGERYNEQFVLAPARGRSFVFGTRIEFDR
ncbi:MAG: TonB-dependent receptor [Aridibacter famidurans]|nr:TonB-dependent receptor [Aridibacter famidurans]